MRVWYCSIGFAWMLAAATLIPAVCLAEDAPQTYSVMVRRSVAGATPAPTPTPAPSAAADAPAWASPASSPPQTLPDVSDAKPIASPAVVETAPAGAVQPASSDGKLNLPNPPDMATQPSGDAVEPAQYQEPLPTPTSGATRPGSSPPSQSVLVDSVQRATQVELTETLPTKPSTAIDLGAQAAAHAAADLLKSSMNADARGATEPVSLRQLLENCPEKDRAEVAHAYWELSRATSNHGWAHDELKRLEQIVPSRNSAENPMLAAARGAAAARLTEAELDIAKALSKLQSTPVEVAVKINTLNYPLVGPYHTYYSQIFGNRPVLQAHIIDQTLPIRLKAINDWVATVHSVTSAVHYAEKAHAKGEVDLRTVLACHDDLRTQRRKFLDAVYRYNVDIAEYAALAAPAGTSPEKFASMLIPAKPPERLSAAPGRPGLPPESNGLRPLPPSGNWVPSSPRSSPEQRSSTEATPASNDRYGYNSSNSNATPATAVQPPAGLPPAGLPPAGLPPAVTPPAVLPSAGQQPALQPSAAQPASERADPFSRRELGGRYGLPQQ